MITPSMTTQEILIQMESVANDSPAIVECEQKFRKMCRKLPKGKVTLTRRFVHRPTNQAYIMSCGQYNGIAGMLLIAEVDHGNQKWYYIFSNIIGTPINIFSTHFFRRYAEREGLPYVMPNIITQFFMANRNQIMIYESDDKKQSAYAFRNGISLSSYNPQLHIVKHCTYISRDMLGETQENALSTVLDELDRAESFQRKFTPVYKATVEDEDALIEANTEWGDSNPDISQHACEIYRQYFEEGME